MIVYKETTYLMEKTSKQKFEAFGSFAVMLLSFLGSLFALYHLWDNIQQAGNWFAPGLALIFCISIKAWAQHILRQIGHFSQAWIYPLIDTSDGDASLFRRFDVWSFIGYVVTTIILCINEGNNSGYIHRIGWWGWMFLLFFLFVLLFESFLHATYPLVTPKDYAVAQEAEKRRKEQEVAAQLKLNEDFIKQRIELGKEP